MLNLSSGIDSLTEFKRDTSKFLNQLKETGDPIVLTLNGKAEVVVQSAEGYQIVLDRLNYLETRDAIQAGLKEVQEGETQAALPALKRLKEKVAIG